MTRGKISRRSLLGLARDAPAPGRPLDDFYDKRNEKPEPGPRPKIPEELQGPIEATWIGTGTAETAEPEAPEDIPLPDLQDQEIDEATIRQLVFDIDRAAELLDVRFKGGVTEHARRGTPSLTEAVTALIERRVAGVQLRYRYRGRQWWDTLIRTADGARIVRIEQPFS